MSDGTFIWREIDATVGEVHSLSGVMPVGVRPLRALPAIFTPRRLSAAWNASAAKRAGLAWKYGRDLPVRPWLNARALSGPTSLEVWKFEDGGPRNASNADSSPMTRPVMRFRPPSASCLASAAAVVALNVGSPPPRRTTSPVMTPAASGSVVDSTEVVSVPSGP